MLEYDKEEKELLEKLVDNGCLKKQLQARGLGRLSFTMFAPEEDAPRKRRDKCNAILDGHTAANLCLASAMIMGILRMTEKVKVEVAPRGYRFDEGQD